MRVAAPVSSPRKAQSSRSGRTGPNTNDTACSAPFRPLPFVTAAAGWSQRRQRNSSWPWKLAFPDLFRTIANTESHTCGAEHAEHWEWARGKHHLKARHSTFLLRVPSIQPFRLCRPHENTERWARPRARFYPSNILELGPEIHQVFHGHIKLDRARPQYATGSRKQIGSKMKDSKQSIVWFCKPGVVRSLVFCSCGNLPVAINGQVKLTTRPQSGETAVSFPVVSF